MTSAARKREYDYAWRVVKWWGQRNSDRARFRTVAPLFERPPITVPAVDRWLSLVHAWPIRLYPSQLAVLRAVCGIKSRTTLLRWRRNGPPPEQCERLARFLESRVERELALIAELRAEAARATTAKLPNYFARDLTVDERYRIAGEKRAKREALKRLRAGLPDEQ